MMASQTIRPHIATASSGWSVFGAASIPEALDEETQNGDTDYIQCSAVAMARAVLDLQNHGVPEDALFDSLLVGCYVRRLAGVVGSHTASIGLRIGETDYWLAAIDETVPLPVSYGLLSGVAAVNPATGTAWTAAAINAAKVSLQAIMELPRATIRITQAYMMLTYRTSFFVSRRHEGRR